MTRTKTQETRRDRLADCGRRLGRFLGDQAGVSFVIAALAFPVVLGMAGLGLDAAMWYMDKRQNQTIADNAAVAGTIALRRDAGISESDLAIVVRGSAADNGFVHGTHGAVTVNSPPAAGPNAGNAGFVEVIVTQSARVAFSTMIMDQAFMVRARAVGGVSTFGEHCVVALDPTADGAITVAGTADITSDCGMASNSSSESAINIVGNATVNAQPLQTYGDITEMGSADVVHEYPPQPLSERVEDPYAGIITELQAKSSCVGASAQNLGSADSPLAPGRYCGGIKVMGDLVFLPGTYYIDNGDFDISGAVDVSGDGVTFILTAMDAPDEDDQGDQGGGGDQGGEGDQGDQGDQGGGGGGGTSPLGTIKITSTGVIDLRAPDSGPYAGMLFIQDPYVPGAADMSPIPKSMLTGGSSMNLLGAIYLPDQELVYTGGTEGVASCTLLTAKKVTFLGTVSLDNDDTVCQSVGVTGISQTRVRLME